MSERFLQRYSLRIRSLLTATFLSVFAAGFAAQKAAPEKPLAAASDAPLSIGIVVDNSGSYRSIFERVINSTNALIADIRTNDEAFLVTFVDTPKIVLRQEMTSDQQQLRDSAENMFIEGGATAILDAAMFSAKYLSEQAKAEPERSRVLILITDGDERESAANIDDVVKTLRAGNIRVFVLGLHEEKIYGKVIDRLIKDTGGAKFVPRTPKETAAAVTSLLSAIRAK